MVRKPPPSSGKVKKKKEGKFMTFLQDFLEQKRVSHPTAPPAPATAAVAAPDRPAAPTATLHRDFFFNFLNQAISYREAE